MQLNQPFAWLQLLATLVPLHLMGVMWRRREVAEARPVILFLAAMAVWSMGYAFELFNTRLEALLFWAKIEYIGIVVAPVAWLMFAIQYARRGHWLVPANVMLLLTEPALILFIAFTNELHGFLYQQASVGYWNNFAILEVVRGPAFWAHAAFSYLALVAGTLLVLVPLLRERRAPRAQSGWVLLGVLSPWVGNLIYLLRLTPIDPTPLGFTLTGLALSVSITRYQMFDVIPIARGQVLDRMVDPVLVVNQKGEILEANPAARNLFSHVRGDLAGKSLDIAFAPWPDALAVLTGGGVEWAGEVNLGNTLIPHWFHLRISGLYYEPEARPKAEKRLFGRLFVLQDIQSRKQLEEAMADARDQALEASLFKGQLIANVSQDLRTPLNTILGYTEMLLEGTYGPVLKDQAEVMRQMLLSAQEMGLFVGDLLDHALIEKGKFTLYPIDFQPEDLLSGVQSLIGQAAEQKRLQLRISADPDLPPVLHGDVKRLQQIIMNLVHNAIKFTQEGWVSVRLYRVSSSSWGIEVSDTGAGISQEARSVIFKPFRQFDKAAEQPGGAGLGLAIVRHLVQMMGGHIELESHLGLGSVFRVILPITNNGAYHG